MSFPCSLSSHNSECRNSFKAEQYSLREYNPTTTSYFLPDLPSTSGHCMALNSSTLQSSVKSNTTRKVITSCCYNYTHLTLLPRAPSKREQSVSSLDEELCATHWKAAAFLPPQCQQDHKLEGNCSLWVDQGALITHSSSGTNSTFGWNHNCIILSNREKNSAEVFLHSNHRQQVNNTHWFWQNCVWT